MLAYFVEAEMEFRRSKGLYKGSFATNCCFIGYQSRGALPSNFDVNYAYNLGYATVKLIASGINGYITTIQNLKGPVSSWAISGVPILCLFENNHDHSETPGISKTFVDINGPSFAALQEDRAACSIGDRFENPGPLQFFGPQVIQDLRSRHLSLESFSYMHEINLVRHNLSAVEEACRPGCSSTLLSIALKNLSALTEVIEVIQKHENK
jgi:pyrophosphate--fructose-6-phosphate 1-phosphotransferase